MTASNIVDASRQNGHSGSDNHEKTPEEIQLEIARTRSAITEDLLALSEKLSPQHLRESAREVMKDAREEAKEVLREAKDAAIDSLRDVKDRALSSVNETVGVIGERAKRAGGITVDFVSANAVAVSLLSLGAGWLVWALRHRKREGAEYAYRYEHYSYPTESYGSEEAAPAPGRVARAKEQVRAVASRASHAVDSAREQVRTAASHAGDGAGSLSRRAGRGLRDAGRSTRQVASDNRLAVVGLTIAAGLGLGLLLPIGKRPREALRRAGGRLMDEAQDLRGRFGGSGGSRRTGVYDIELGIGPEGVPY